MRLSFTSLFFTPALVLVLGGCSVAELKQRFTAPTSWTNASNVKVAENPAVLKEWWKDFHDETLNSLVDASLKNNPDLNSAAARIVEARGLQKTAKAELLPQITGNVGANRGTSLFPPSVITGNNYNADFDASYELDLFGRNRSAAQAANANTRASQADYEWTRLSLIAEVARSYVALRAQEKQIALANKDLNSQKQTLGLVQRQYSAGGASEFDVERSNLDLNQLRARIIDNQRARDGNELALVTLTGLSPQELRRLIKTKAVIPGINLKPLMLAPADVMAHRPDIAAANARLAQATSLKQAEAASVFPTITISGLFGIAKNVFLGPETNWSLGGNTAVSLLDFGRIRGRIDAASAREVQAYEAWHKTMLQAVQDVETSLMNVSRLREQRQILEKTRTNANKAVQLAQLRHREGDLSLLNVLDAQRRQIDTDSALVQAEENYTTAIIALYKALGQY